MDKLSRFVEDLRDDEVLAALNQLQKLQTEKPTQTGKDLRIRLILRWGEKDVRAAAEWSTTKMEAGEDRQEAIDAVAGQWARMNVAEATAWAGKLPDNGEREGALTSVAGSVVYTAPQNSLTLATTLPSGPARDDIIARASGIWAYQAPEQAVAWAKQIPDEALRQSAIKHIAFTWGEKNPVAAGDLAVTALPPGPEQEQAVIGVVQRWWLVDPTAAAAWVNRFPEGKLRQIATDTIEQTEARLKLGKSPSGFN